MESKVTVTVTLGFRKKGFTHFMYTKTTEDAEGETKYYSGVIDAFISNGKHKGQSKVYRNVDGALMIQSYEKGVDNMPVAKYSKAMVNFNIKEGALFIPAKSIWFKFNDKLYTLKPGQQITFGTQAEQEVKVSEF